MTAAEMIEDLKETLKNPEGDFVRMTERVDAAKTQRVQTVNNKNSNEFKEYKEDEKKKKSFFMLSLILSN